MKDHSSSRDTLPILSRDSNNNIYSRQKQERKLKPTKGAIRFSPKSSLRQNTWFRSFLALISLQVVILFLTSLFLGDTNLEQGWSRTRTLQLLHGYYEDHNPYSSATNSIAVEEEEEDLAATPGIIVDDDDTTAKSKNSNHNRNNNVISDEGGDDDLNELEDHLADQTEAKLIREEELLLLEEGEDNSDPSASKVGGDLDNKKENPILDDTAETSPIDNYYTRQIEKQEQIRNRVATAKNNGDDSNIPFPFLIVGGSDGSGTRAFVTALGKLGIPMLVDDRGTMDVHGKQLFDGAGWPPLAQLILKHTHSANYEVDDLPEDVRNTIVTELVKFKTEMVNRGRKHDVKEQERRLKKHHHVNHYNNNMHPASAYHGPSPGYPKQQQRSFLVQEEQRDSMEDIENAAFEHAPLDMKPDKSIMDSLSSSRSSVIQYGWKAPVSMLLLPFLREVFGPVKFLHVVRDGRDIALSSNQSPVKKFYKAYYGKEGQNVPVESATSNNNTDAMSVLAMQLWTDWNFQVLEYEKAHSSDNDFDYLVMHTEELLNPETKFQSLQQLGHFVGSPSSLSDLCCQSQQAVVDMGVSSVAMGDKGGRPKRLHRHGQGEYNKYGEQDSKEHTKDLAEFQQMLQGMNQKRADRHGHLRHHGGQLGSDPILGNIQQESNGEDEEEETDEGNEEGFDAEAGRHNGWHHGHMETESIIKNARAKHADYMQHRNDRFKGLQKRVGAHQQKVWQRNDHKRNPQKESHRQHVPAALPRANNANNSQGPSTATQDRAHRISANYQARKQRSHEQMGVDPSQQDKDKETMEFLFNHDHEARLEAMQRRAGLESHLVEHGNDNDSPRHRRLMSAFHKFGYQLKKQKQPATPAPEKEAILEPKEHSQHRQFKPKRNEGGQVFQEREQPLQVPQAAPTGGGWSMASIGEALGISSPYNKHSLVAVPSRAGPHKNADIKNSFDQAIQDEFEHMPLLPIHSNRPPGLSSKHYHDHNHKKESATRVKSRYGKWVAYLQDKPELSRQLHELGQQSLDAFGYEPAAQFMDNSGVDLSFQCDSTVVCKKKGTHS